MNKKKLNKTVWYSSELDVNKKPILPPIADSPTDLNGLHEGEIFLHNSDEDPSIWIRTSSGKIQRLNGTGENISFWELMTDESGNKYIFTKYHLVTQFGMTMYSGEDGLNLPSIYDGLPIDSKTIYWEDIKDDNGVVIGKILKAKTGGGTLGSLTNVGEWADSVADVDRIMVQKKGSDTWKAMDASEIGSASFENIFEGGDGNAYTSFVLSGDKKSITLMKGMKFATTNDLDKRINNLINGAPAAYDTLKEIADVLQGNVNSIGDIITTLGTKWTQDDTKIANWDAAFSWGDHSKAGYAAKSYVDSTFVTIAGNEDVTGIHNFTNGLKIGGKLIDKTKDDVIYIDANLVVRGGITMYGDRDANIPSILNSIPTAGYDDIQARGLIAFNSKHFVINNGVVSAIQGSAGLDVEQLDNYLKNNHYATEDWVRDYVLENASGGIESITNQMVIDALGYTPYSAENPNGYITAASIPSALKNPYALTFGSKTYDGSAAKSITASDLGAALSSDLSEYLPLSGGTLTDILTIKSGGGYGLKIQSTNNDIPSIVFSGTSGSLGRIFIYGLNGSFYRANNNFSTMFKIWDEGNDGSGSGLDADTLDGKHLSDILASNVASANGLSVQAVTTDDFSKYIGAYGALGLSVLTNTSGAAVGNIGATYTVLNIGGNNMNRFGRFLFNRADDSSQLYWQTANSAMTAWGAMRQVAFVDSNVASATKLQTPRTIWGQSFDGSKDITGCLHITSYNGDYTQGIRINTMDGSSSIFFNTTNASGYDSGMWGITANAYGNLRFRGGATSLFDFLVVTRDGNVGIGTTNPTCALDVNGSISVSADANITGDLRLKGSGNYGNTLYFGDGSYCYITEPSDDAMKIYGSKGVTIDGGVTYGLSVVSMASFTDNVGIGTDEPSYKLHVVGSAYISSNLLTGGGITMYSQRSLKNVVDERGLSISELSEIKPTRYTWKDNRDNRIHFGGIADDIQQVLPEVVYKTEEGVLTMDYGNAGFAIAASLIKPVVDHEEKIRQLQKRVSELEQELNRLRA